MVPHRRLGRAIVFAQHAQHVAAPRLEVLAPRRRRALVVRPIQPPGFLHRERAWRRPCQQPVAGHDATTEEMSPHPVVIALGLERVCVRGVTEHVDEQAAVVAKPGRHALEEPRPVAHVLEHLDADDAIELPARVEVVHVGRSDFEVAHAARLEKRPLRRRIRDGHDPRRGILRRHVQRERAPAATELQDILPVGESGPFAREREHRVLRVVQRAHARRPDGARVLPSPPQHELEELARHLVMLRVGDVGHFRDPRPLKLGKKLVDAARTLYFAQALRAQLPNGPSHKRRGNEPVLRHRHADAHRSRPRGGQGRNALVVRWYSRYASPRLLSAWRSV